MTKHLPDITMIEILLFFNVRNINYKHVAELDEYAEEKGFMYAIRPYTYNLNNQEILYADVSVSSNAPIGHVAELMVHVTNLDGGLNISFPIYLSIGQITENFESGFSNVLNWEFSGNANWEVTDNDQYEGLYSAVSGDIDHSQSSELSVTLDVVIDGNIAFYYTNF